MDTSYYKKFEPIFGAWHIVREIGAGSYGKVFEIEREDFGHVYKSALKVLSVPQNESELDNIRSVCGDERSATEYFSSLSASMSAEFELMSKLKGHSNIVSYEDHAVFRQDNGIGWDILIRMELLTPLVKYAGATPLTEADVVKLGIDICKALELCRRHNIIHRDIKPENIFVSPNGDFKLGDFGIAKTVDKTTGGLSQKGTYTYMAPEVYKGSTYGAGVDLYSLGIVLYRYLNNNRAPFYPEYPAPVMHSDTEKALGRRMTGEPIPSIKGVSPELNSIVLKACAFNPKDRFASPTEMRKALGAYLGIDVADVELTASVGSETVAIRDEPGFSNRSLHPSQNATYKSVGAESLASAVPFTPADFRGSAAPVAGRAMPNLPVCPTCGKPYTPGEAFCGGCGRALNVRAAVPPVAPLRPIPVTPPPVKPVTPPPAAKAGGDSSQKTLLTVILIVAAAAILAVCLFLAMSDSDPDPDYEDEPVYSQAVEPEETDDSSRQNSEDSSSASHNATDFTDAQREEICQSIKERFYYTEDILSSCSTTEYDDGTVGYYDSNNQLVMLIDGPNTCLDYDEYDFPNSDLKNFTGYYYFDYDAYEIYFAYFYCHDNGHEYRLYFSDGKLVRWMDYNGNIYDGDGEYWDTMQELFDYIESRC